MHEPTDISPQQMKILEFLMDKPYQQKDLQSKLEISSPGLLYHLDKLEKHKFIQKNTVLKVGNAKINEISIDPIQLQAIRSILNRDIGKYTLITGFGELEDGYRIPDQSYLLLQNIHFKIDHVVCFTTIKGKSIRDHKETDEKLIKIDKYYADFEYNDFRNPDSKFFQQIDSILREDLKSSNIVIDITPLSKLYSFEMLKRANQYNLACYYIGHDQQENDIVIWMTDVKINGELKTEK